MGKAPEQFALEVLKDKLQVGLPAPSATSPERWVADIQAWASSHRSIPHDADDIRESTYAEHTSPCALDALESAVRRPSPDDCRHRH